MKIVQNYNVSNIQNIRQKPVFMQNTAADAVNDDSEISHVIPDFNVSRPIPYNKIEDINLGNNLTAHYYKLANGQKVVIVPKKGTTVVKTYVNTGSLNEPDKLRGISHYIEHNLFNGSESLGEENVFDEVNKIGGYANASTSFSVTDYIIESKKPNTAVILKEIQIDKVLFKTVLRLVTPTDNSEYKNSIITFMKIDDKEWNRLLRNKKILYKKE